MATLTEQMRDLTADVLNGHEERRVWLAALKEQVGSMREENRAELGTLRREVRDTLEESQAAREEAAATARKERKTWLGGLKKEVKGMRKEFRTDQQGARLAWQEMASLVTAPPKSASRRGK
jgi:regulator of replication initiation timing